MTINDQSPFRRVVDDLTAGCGCACHTGIGYNASCGHCHRPPARPSGIDVVRLERALEACDKYGEVFLNPERWAREIAAEYDRSPSLDVGQSPAR